MYSCPSVIVGSRILAGFDLHFPVISPLKSDGNVNQSWHCSSQAWIWVGANQSSWSEPEHDLNCQGNAAVLWKGKSTK